MTRTPNAERLAVELSLSAFTTKVCQGWDLNTQPFECKPNDLTHCATFADLLIYIHILFSLGFLFLKQFLPIDQLSAL